jgi:hypothetical protein
LTFLAAIAFVLTGCGTYRIVYVNPDIKPSFEKTSITYAHGWGIAGGGGYFFAVHRIIPCFVDYTGPVDLRKYAPNGFQQIDQHQTFGQNALAAFISWLILVNPYHPSTVEIARVPSPAPSRIEPGVRDETAPEVVELNYDDRTKRGRIRVKIAERRFDDVRAWTVKRIEEIVATKSKKLVTNSRPPGGGYFLLDEEMKDGILRIEFEARD